EAVVGKAFPIVVEAGETLEDIARAYIVPVEEIRKINNLAPGAQVKAGDTLLIPPSVYRFFSQRTDGAEGHGFRSSLPRLERRVAGGRPPLDHLCAHAGGHRTGHAGEHRHWPEKSAALSHETSRIRHRGADGGTLCGLDPD